MICGEIGRTMFSASPFADWKSAARAGKAFPLLFKRKETHTWFGEEYPCGGHSTIKRLPRYLPGRLGSYIQILPDAIEALLVVSR